MRLMADVAKPGTRLLVEQVTAGSSPVVRPNVPPSLGGVVVSKTVTGGSSPSGGANMTATCAECDRKRERCRAAVRRVGGKVDYVCPQCWRRLDYEGFMQVRAGVA